jgi:hypothetical protein
MLIQCTLLRRSTRMSWQDRDMFLHSDKNWQHSPERLKKKLSLLKDIMYLKALRCMNDTSSYERNNGNSSKSKPNTTTGKTVLKLVKFQSLRKISLTSRTLWIFKNSKFYKEMYVGGQALLIHFLVKFRISKNSYFINNKPIFLKLRIFTNFNTSFPVVILVFDFEEFSWFWKSWADN